MEQKEHPPDSSSTTSNHKDMRLIEALQLRFRPICILSKKLQAALKTNLLHVDYRNKELLLPQSVTLLIGTSSKSIIN